MSTPDFLDGQSDIDRLCARRVALAVEESLRWLQRENMSTPVFQFDSVEKRFVKRSGILYDSMAKRFREKKSEKTGRILRIGRELEFSKDEFRQWLGRQLGGENGVLRCPYCWTTWVSIDDLTIDHNVSVARGGSLGLENLVVCCEPCNQAKGQVTGRAWSALVAWAKQHMHPDDWQNIYERLQSQFKLARMAQREAAQRAGKVKAREEADLEDQF